MRIGKRLFPYPILNNDKLYSQFNSSIFSLNYEEELDEYNYILRDLHVKIENELLISLIEKKKANIICVVECASTMLRKTYILPLKNSISVYIPLYEINGMINVSSYVVASEDIDNYYSDDFLDEYKDYSFMIEKNCILAADDGFSNKLDFTNREDDRKSSVFLVIKDKTIDDNTMRIDYDSEKIYINLPEIQWNIYDKTKRISLYQNMYFSILVLPALLSCINGLKSSGESVDVLRMDYAWFDSFAATFEKNNNKEFDDEIFERLDLPVEIQKMFDVPVIKAIDTVFNLSMGTIGGEY